MGICKVGIGIGGKRVLVPGLMGAAVTLGPKRAINRTGSLARLGTK